MVIYKKNIGFGFIIVRNDMVLRIEVKPDGHAWDASMWFPVLIELLEWKGEVRIAKVLENRGLYYACTAVAFSFSAL